MKNILNVVHISSDLISHEDLLCGIYWLSQFTRQSVEVPLTSSLISLFKLRTKKKSLPLSLSGCLLKRSKAARGVEVDQPLLDLYVRHKMADSHREVQEVMTEAFCS